MVYKPPKTIDEQLDYLYDVKNVRYNVMSRDAAKDVLIKYGYINVITPFKQKFALKDKKGCVCRDSNGLHIYPREVDFKEYYDSFNKEREVYPIIYSNIMDFEETFNALVSYHIINTYQISNRDSFIDFFEKIKVKISLDKGLSKEVKQHMIEEMNNAINDFDKYDSVFITFDRLTITKIIALFRMLDNVEKRKIFNQVVQLKLSFNYNNINTFESFLIRLPSIRNCVFHFNSTTILINYYDIKNKGLRKDNDKSEYYSIIKKLSVKR